MGISDLFVSGYTAKKTMEASGDYAEVTDTLSTDTDIGTSGAFSACQRQLSGRELDVYARDGFQEVSRFYTETTGLTTNHWIEDPDGKFWNIININDPHGLGLWYQIDAKREFYEKENE